MEKTLKLPLDRTHTAQGTAQVMGDMVRAKLNDWGNTHETELTPATVSMVMDLAVTQAVTEMAAALGRIADNLGRVLP